MDLHRLQGYSLPHHGCLLDRLQGTSARVPGAPPCPPSSLTLVSAELFLSHLTPLSAALYTAVFFPPFLNTLSQRFYHHHLWTWPCPAAGLSWILLALALTDMGEDSSSFSQKSPM